MTIQLKPGQEQAINAAIRAGAFRSVDEFMDTAIAILPNSVTPDAAPVARRKSRLWELREGLSLGNLTIKELIEEGRGRYGPYSTSSSVSVQPRDHPSMG